MPSNKKITMSWQSCHLWYLCRGPNANPAGNSSTNLNPLFWYFFRLILRVLTSLLKKTISYLKIIFSMCFSFPDIPIFISKPWYTWGEIDLQHNRSCPEADFHNLIRSRTYGQKYFSTYPETRFALASSWFLLKSHQKSILKSEFEVWRLVKPTELQKVSHLRL